jgi:hypothetical protein
MADDLERELRDLAAFLETPPTPDVTVQVRRRLSARRRPRWRIWLAVLLGAVTLALLPVAAQAVDALLDFAGIGIRPTPAPSLPATPSPLPGATIAGVAGLQDKVLFPVRTPAALGDPEKVILGEPGKDGKSRVLSFAYRHDTVQFDTFDGRLDLAFIKTGAVDTEWTEVNGTTALWLPTTHALVYVDRSGVTRTETARLSGPTLIWESGGVTYRLEGIADRDEAIRIASTLR